MLATGWMRGVRRAMPRARSMSSFEYKAGNDIVIRNALVWVRFLYRLCLEWGTLLRRSRELGPLRMLSQLLRPEKLHTYTYNFSHRPADPLFVLAHPVIAPKPCLHGHYACSDG
eukprot:1346165-Amorphochlora_amoeboformis.AAC.2